MGWLEWEEWLWEECEKVAVGWVCVLREVLAVVTSAAGAATARAARAERETSVKRMLFDLVFCLVNMRG